ncbi:MAG: hypothetical protein DRJ66_05960 [Thermoprotei archaeon]|mgnify:CR=1 FL=1|nr:MAG: hypothetical protein DRJ66_05960 [Thermoprotei archaeon]RLF19617.1 MAG: hypothetical protein DRZ82_05070 [Thermoprotei archaeon]
MSTYILMKLFERMPHIYDKGMRILSFGKIDEIYDDIISYVRHGQRVLDIGCGTGALALRAARKGAKVKGIDVNVQMLKIARRKALEEMLTENVEFQEMSIIELEKEVPESYDVVISGFLLSELTEEERTYTLRRIWNILRPGGLLLIVDIAMPKDPLRKAISWLIMLPLLIVVYLVTGSTVYPVKDLPEIIEKLGFIVERVKYNRLKNLIELVARKPEGKMDELT